LSRFKFGTRENAWANVSTSALLEAAQRLTVRVKGQQEIINEIVPVLIRAKLGMTDLAGKVTSAKPRGVFFFVGPTGVGKTELSKAIAELIFGDEQSLLRFDMSEYSEEHQQARLVGAPPGYVGFDQGGQLTNAISEKPFSVVLFDEIEKAHGRILDKFLQILDDGRLTDGMGKTVYFTESIIIFTSNLGSRSPVAGSNDGKVGLPVPSNSRGIASTSGNCNYLRGLEYPELCDHFREAVKHFFVEKLGRPEILNRIGEENILVFRFLTDDGAKIEILEQQIKNMQLVLQERHHVKIYCTQAFKKLLMVHQSGFDRNGARGVRNLLNRFVLNHLAPDLLVRGDQLRGKTLRIDYFVDAAQIASEPFNVSNLNYTWIDQ
jgi:ATP-dependent Clp protease ATP-binding subunit ClpA